MMLNITEWCMVRRFISGTLNIFIVCKLKFHPLIMIMMALYMKRVLFLN